MNVQYAIKDGDDLHPRGQPARLAHRALCRQSHWHADRQDRRAASWPARASQASTSSSNKFKHVAVKEAVFPFNRFPGVDTVLGPEMKSTGEVMGLDTELCHGLRQEPDRLGQQGAARRHRVRLRPRRRQSRRSSSPCATSKPPASRSSPPAAPSAISSKTASPPRSQQGARRPPAHRRLHEERRRAARHQHHRRCQIDLDSRDIRRTALMRKIPYYTTIPGALAAVEGIIAYATATSPSARCRIISRAEA